LSAKHSSISCVSYPYISSYHHRRHLYMHRQNIREHVTIHNTQIIESIHLQLVTNHTQNLQTSSDTSTSSGMSSSDGVRIKLSRVLSESSLDTSQTLMECSLSLAPFAIRIVSLTLFLSASKSMGLAGKAKWTLAVALESTDARNTVPPEWDGSC
jgi:hypothetical protein